jgi:hypothetical protein
MVALFTSVLRDFFKSREGRSGDTARATAKDSGTEGVA